MEVGDKIRLTYYVMGHNAGSDDYTIEEFRHCLGIFRSDDHRKASCFTPLCFLYERGPESKDDYIANYGEYVTNMVPAFMNVPKD